MTTTTSTTTPYLWVRHATQERAEQGAANLATTHPHLIFFVVPDPTVSEYPHAVLSIAEEEV